MWDQLVTCNTACKMFETLKEEVFFFSSEVYVLFLIHVVHLQKSVKIYVLLQLLKELANRRNVLACISTVIKRTWNRLIAAWAFKELTNA